MGTLTCAARTAEPPFARPVSREYKGDAWHLLVCGLAGGKTVLVTVGSHPATFAT
jgi:hypothetical protein